MPRLENNLLHPSVIVCLHDYVTLVLVVWCWHWLYLLCGRSLSWTPGPRGALAQADVHYTYEFVIDCTKLQKARLQTKICDASLAELGAALRG